MLCLAHHGIHLIIIIITPTVAVSVMLVSAMVPVVWTLSAFQLVGVIIQRWHDLWLQHRPRCISHSWVESSKWSCQTAKPEHRRFSASQLALVIKPEEHLQNPWLWSHGPTPSLNTPKLAMLGTCDRSCLFLSSWALKSALLSPPALFVQGEFTLGKLLVSRAT